MNPSFEKIALRLLGAILAERDGDWPARNRELDRARRALAQLRAEKKPKPLRAFPWPSKGL